MVKIYPTLPAGAATVPGMASEFDNEGQPIGVEVSEERAAELMAYMPPAWTTNADGSPTEAHLAQEAQAFEAAWGADHPKPEHLAGVEVPKPKSLGSMTLPELHVQAAARGLPVDGKKAELLERIQAHDESAGDGDNKE